VCASATDGGPGGSFVSIRLLVADPYPVCARGIAAVLQAAPDIEIVGITHDGDDAVHRALALQPDVILMDVDLPTSSGISVLTRIQAAHVETRGVFLTARTGEKWETLASEAGAAAYIDKRSDLSTLADVLRAVHAGRRVWAGPGEPLERAPSERPAITPKELQVLRYIAHGMSSREISAALHRSPRTIDKHRESMRKKLGVHSSAALLRYAILHLQELELRTDEPSEAR
jgi:DNA-binding NarL/FixJ family response regulator